jgi:hypothetical protein
LLLLLSIFFSESGLLRLCRQSCALESITEVLCSLDKIAPREWVFRPTLIRQHIFELICMKQEDVAHRSGEDFTSNIKEMEEADGRQLEGPTGKNA